MIKIISMDFDGTLLTSNKRISNKTRNSLIKYKNKSYKIIGITARNLMSVNNILDTSIFDYIIINNGSDIYYVNEDKIDNISSIDKETAIKLYNLFKNKSYKIDFCTAYNYQVKSNIKDDNRSFVNYINELDEINNPISRINIFFETTKELEENKKLIENTFNNITVVKMLDTDNPNTKLWLTINPKGINKLNALNKVCDILKCNLDEVIFFGDGENDLILIENVGIGVAMANAIDIVKEKASYITLSNDNDGIAEYLEKNI